MNFVGDYAIRDVDALSQMKNSYIKNVDALSQMKNSYAIKSRTFSECCAAAIAWHKDKDASTLTILAPNPIEQSHTPYAICWHATEPEPEQPSTSVPAVNIADGFSKPRW